MSATFDMINRIKANRSMQRKTSYFSMGISAVSTTAYAASPRRQKVNFKKLNEIKLKWEKQERIDLLKCIIGVTCFVFYSIYIMIQFA